MDQNKQDRYEYLASQWKNKTINKEEEMELFGWLNSAEEISVDIPASFANSETSLKNEIYNEINRIITTRRSKSSIVRMWPRVTVAAAIFFVIGTGTYFLDSKYWRTGSLINSSNNILPGGNKAMLTLANGNTINLDSIKTGLVIGPGFAHYTSVSSDTNNDAVSAHELPKIGTNEQLMVSTPIGGTYQVVLSDGTHVWLNAASKLTFPSNFADLNFRKVKLIGEAYFEVAKDKDHPFIVTTDGQEVDVLGTHFNINAYADEGCTKTTLLEGLVKVSSGANNLLLKPNQQSILADRKILVQTVDASDVIAWKNGKFTFEREEINSIMRKVARWYNVQVFYEDNLTGVRLTGSVSRFENISKLLEILENTEQVHFKIDGNKIIVKK